MKTITKIFCALIKKNIKFYPSFSVIVLLVLFCLGMVPILHGQDVTTWMRTHDYERRSVGMAVQQTNEDQYLIAGHCSSVEIKEGHYPPSDMLLMKIDINGDTVWTKTYGADYSVNSMEPTSEGGYILTGAMLDTVNLDSDIALINIDTNGDTLWTKIYIRSGSDWGNTAQQTVDGGYIIAGKINFNHWDNADAHLIKTDETGEILWAKTDTNVFNYGHVEPTSDEGYIISASYKGKVEDSIGGSWRESISMIIKTDPFGDTLWTKSYENFELAWNTCINQTTDGGYIITGNTNSEEEKTDVWLEKIDENGLTVWTKTYIIDKGGEGKVVQQTEDGGFIILAEKGSFYDDEEERIWLIKTDANGETLWTKTYRGIRQSGEDIKQTSDGGYIILGNAWDTPDRMSPYVWMIKTDANGNVTPSSVDENSKEHMTKIYPNPTNNIINIEIINPDKAIIEIYNVNGTLIFSKAIDSKQEQIDISGFSKGIFIIRVMQANAVYVGKVVVR